MFSKSDSVEIVLPSAAALASGINHIGTFRYMKDATTAIVQLWTDMNGFIDKEIAVCDLRDFGSQR